MSRDPERRHILLDALEGPSANDLAALAGISPQEVLLLTGYWPVMGCSLALLTRAGKAVCVVPEDEVELAQTTTDAELIPYQPGSLDTLAPIEETIAPALRKAMAGLELKRGEIGMNLLPASSPTSYLSLHRLQIALPALFEQAASGIRTVDCAPLIDRLLAVKSVQELECLRRACKDAGSGFAAAADAIQAGRRENEVAAEIASAFESSSYGGFARRQGHFFCMSGPNSFKASAAYARTRDRILQHGDLVMIHANTAGDGYWTDVTRTYVVGPPTPQHQAMYAAVAAARQEALQQIRPGARASAVDAAARDLWASRGYGAAFKHATGHGVGFAAADGRALPRIHPQSPDILKAGMTFNIEPAIYIEGVGGLRHCDVVVCGQDGADVLTDFDRMPGGEA